MSFSTLRFFLLPLHSDLERVHIDTRIFLVLIFGAQILRFRYRLPRIKDRILFFICVIVALVSLL